MKNALVKAASIAVTGLMLAQPVFAIEPYANSLGAPEKEVALRVAGKTNVIDISGFQNRWNRRDLFEPRSLESFVVLMRCKFEDCINADWRMVYARRENGVVKNYRSSNGGGGGLVYGHLSPVKFEFDTNSTARNSLYRKGDGSEFSPLSLTLICTTNCPTLGSHWPVIMALDRAPLADSLFLDTPTGPILPWFEMHAVAPRTDATRVSQFGLTETGQEVGEVDEGATLPFHAIRMSMRMESIQGMPTAVEFEVRPKDESFRDEATHFSSFSEAGKVAHLVLRDLPPGKYHWQYRVVDPIEYLREEWIEFRTIGNTDFIVPLGAAPKLKPLVSGMRQERVIGALGRHFFPEGGGTTETSVVLYANATSKAGNTVEFEVKAASEPFDGMNTVKRETPWGVPARINAGGALNVPRKWRVRLIDLADPTNMSAWVEFGTPGNVDFTKFSAE